MKRWHQPWPPRVSARTDLASASLGQDSRLPNRRILGKFPRSQHRPFFITPPKLKVPAYQWRVRVIFVESECSQSHKPFESESIQSHLKFFRVESESEPRPGRVESESSHKNCRATSSQWFASSSQCRVTRNFTFFLRQFFPMKWHPTCHKMSPIS